MKQMKGYLITYNSSNRKDITRINHFLFGRIVTIRRQNQTEKYYYPGFFEHTPYKKISNGCYFVQQIHDNFDGLLDIMPATIYFHDDVMLNAYDYWKNKNIEKVKNWRKKA